LDVVPTFSFFFLVIDFFFWSAAASVLLKEMHFIKKKAKTNYLAKPH
jgi:hypothetical protein